MAVPRPFDFNSVTTFAWLAKPKEEEGKAGHPVYLLTTSGGEQYVVKMERTKGGDDVKTASRSMEMMYAMARVVGGGVSSRSLEDSEVAAFFAMARRLAVDEATQQEMHTMEGYARPLKSERKRTTWLPGFTHTGIDQNPMMWIIMDFQKGLKDLEGLMKSPDLSQIFRTLTDLQKDSNLAALGRILAVDMFLGNNDRFDLERGGITNPGNVFFVSENGAYTLHGIDPVSPNGTNAFHMALDKQSGRWLGFMLNDDAKLKWIAWMALESVVSALFPKLRRNQQVKFAFAFGPAEKDKVYEGIKQGKALIHVLCNRMMQSPRRPAGLQSRMEALGWLYMSAHRATIAPPSLPAPGRGFVIASHRPHP